MNTIKITSRDNKHLKAVSKLLSSARFRKETGLFAVEGLRLCMDAAETGMELETLFYTPTAYKKNKDSIDGLFGKAESCYEVDDAVFAKTADTQSPQGVLCVIRQRPLTMEPKQNGKYIAIEDIQDPSNLGAIARTAEALGADGLVLSAGCCDVYNSKAQRAAMGALFRLPMRIVEDFSGFLKTASIPSFAAVPDSTATPITECDFSSGAIVLVGNEGNGLKNETISLCTHTITIPMKGRAESLNASAAATILLYEMLKQGTTNEVVVTLS
ncbi:MAG: hypothetical protein BGN88_15310 [Clostridiales bacterium 43-6]|nr:MAG: hypothetical protein BGN88_15310 [Clostridiales bacterium 43-6]